MTMGASRHLTRPENAGILRELEAELEQRWQRVGERVRLKSCPFLFRFASSR